MQESPSWRPIFAVLAHPETRGALAQLMLGASLSDALEHVAVKRRPNILANFTAAGLIDPQSHAFNDGIFRALLEGSEKKRSTDITRYLDGPRITNWPAKETDRIALLEWIAPLVLDGGDVITEAVINERLRPFHRDVALLRRYLVDYGVLARASDGSSYSRQT